MKTTRILLTAAIAALAAPSGADAAPRTLSCQAPSGLFAMHARNGASCSTARTVSHRWSTQRCCSMTGVVRAGGSDWSCRVRILNTTPSPGDDTVHGRIACHRVGSKQSVDWQYEGAGA